MPGICTRARKFRTLILFLIGSLLLMIAGCSEPVQEDRTIHMAPNSNSAGFQHGRDGVFVAREGQLEKVFQPDANVIATSGPLWSSDGTRLIFTTATPLEAQTPRSSGPDTWDLFPEGRIYYERPIRYTCWQQDSSPGQTAQPPIALFEARCDHVGYVAANLAVRWHPDGRRILFLDEVAPEQLGVFEFDLATKSRRRVFPHSARAIVFDWSPQGRYLSCVTINEKPESSSRAEAQTNGIWIGHPDSPDWWLVPETNPWNTTALPSLIERLRERTPVWNPTESDFVYTTLKNKPALPPETANTENASPESADVPSEYTLVKADPATRQTTTLATSGTPLRDIHWSPDGTRLTLLRTSPTGHGDYIQEVNPDGTFSAPLDSRPVRRFAGWDQTGQHIGYVIDDASPLTAEPNWAFLFAPNVRGRNAVLIKSTTNTSEPRTVFSQMHVTFLNWSPTDDRVSLWATFQPTVRSWFSMVLGWGLRSGDPAATIDIATGEVQWLAVNDRERIQIAHHHLLRGEYQAALEIYDDVNAIVPSAQTDSIQQLADTLLGRNNFAFFHYLCLTKLGQTERAATKLEEFHANFFPPATPESSQANGLWSPDVLSAGTAWGEPIRDSYVVEVYLSLDLHREAVAYFEDALERADSDQRRYSAALILSQLLLITHEHQRYAEFMTDTLTPLLFQLWESIPPAVRSAQPNLYNSPQSSLLLTGSLALLPMYSDKFVNKLPLESLASLAMRWEQLDESATDHVTHLAVDLFLVQAYRRLGRDAESSVTAERIAANPAATRFLGQQDINAVIRQLHETQQSMSLMSH